MDLKDAGLLNLLIIDGSLTAQLSLLMKRNTSCSRCFEVSSSLQLLSIIISNLYLGVS